MATFDTHAQAVSFRLQEVARTLSQASELAETLGLPGLARDLAVALVTAQRARADFNRDTDATSAAAAATSSPLGALSP